MRGSHEPLLGFHVQEELAAPGKTLHLPDRQLGAKGPSSGTARWKRCSRPGGGGERLGLPWPHPAPPGAHRPGSLMLGPDQAGVLQTSPSAQGQPSLPRSTRSSGHTNTLRSPLTLRLVTCPPLPVPLPTQISAHQILLLSRDSPLLRGRHLLCAPAMPSATPLMAPPPHSRVSFPDRLLGAAPLTGT